jgi:hypothetical protein
MPVVTSRTTFRTVAVVAILAHVDACVPEYHPPTARDPHATLKVRRVYERTGGTSLVEHCDVDDHRALDTRLDTAVASAPHADAFLIYPRPAKIDIASKFVHTEMRSVAERYSEQQPYLANESYSCGGPGSFQTCSRMVTHYQTVWKTRYVIKPVDVTDSACRDELFLAPAVGHVYLIDFTYRDNGACVASCLEQVAAPDGSFTSDRCPTPTQEQLRKLRPSD